MGRRASDWLAEVDTFEDGTSKDGRHRGDARVTFLGVTCSSRSWALGLSNYSWMGHRRAVQIRGWGTLLAVSEEWSALSTGGMSAPGSNQRWSPADGVRSSVRSEAASFKLFRACEVPFLHDWDKLSMRKKTTAARWRT